MKDGLPKISVVTPSYNQAQFLEQTMLSVLDQNYPNLEYIVIDGGSTDDSVDILRKHEKNLAYWVSEPDQGQSHAINKGLARATGDVVFWLNSDDLCLPGALSTVVEAFQQQPRPRMVIGQAYLIDSEGKTCGELISRFTSWEDFALRRCLIRQVSTFFDHRLFEELGGIDESLDWSMDSDLLLRFTRRYPPLIIKEYLVAFRRHKVAKFSSHLVPGYEESDRVRMRHLAGTGLEPAYKGWSAQHWLTLAMYSGARPAERLRCLRNAWRMKPRALFSPYLGSAVIGLPWRWLFKRAKH